MHAAETQPQRTFEEMTARARRILLASTFVAFALGLLFALGQVRGADGKPLVPFVAIVVGATVAGVVGVIAARGESSEPGERVVLWTGGPPPPALSPPPPSPPPSPYRGAPPKAWTPRTSARRTALVMSACLAFTGAAVPFALHLPRWVEMEAVLAGWWLIWAVILTVVARRGAELVDDHALVIRLPWSPSPLAPARARATLTDEPPRSSWWSKIGDLLSFPSDLEALVFVVGLAIVLGVALAGAWLVIEVVAPVLFAVAYFGVVRALRQAAAYRGSTVRATMAGTGWATAYVGPMALLVWLVHRVVAG